MTEEAPAGRNGEKNRARRSGGGVRARQPNALVGSRGGAGAGLWARVEAHRCAAPPAARGARRSDKQRRETGLGVRATLDRAGRGTSPRSHAGTVPRAASEKNHIVLFFAPPSRRVGAGRRCGTASHLRIASPVRPTAPPCAAARPRVHTRACWRMPERRPRHAEHRPIAPLVLLQVVLSLSSGARQYTCSWVWSSGRLEGRRDGV